MNETGSAQKASQLFKQSSCILISVLAEACLQNFRQTLKYGGRKMVPSKSELSAVTVRNHLKKYIWNLTIYNISSEICLHFWFCCFLINYMNWIYKQIFFIIEFTNYDIIYGLGLLFNLKHWKYVAI